MASPRSFFLIAVSVALSIAMDAVGGVSAIAKASGLEFDARGDLSLSGDYRHISQTGFSQLHEVVDGYVFASGQFRARQSGFQLEARPELRGLLSRAAGVPATDPAAVSVRSPRRLLNFSVDLEHGPRSQWVGDLERLNLSFSDGPLEFQIGRKPVSLGVLRVFPVWNKFTRALPGVSSPVIIFGSDLVAARYQSGDVLINTFAIVGSDRTRGADDVQLGELTWYSGAGEFHVLFSHWWNEFVAGAAVAKDLGGATLRAEALSIGLRERDSDRQFQAGLGGEYAFDANWSAVVEGFYQSAGKRSVLDYPIQVSSRFSPLRARAYGFGQLIYKAGTLWTLSAGDLINWVDLGSIAILKAERSLSDSADFFLSANLPLGREGAEFSTRSFLFTDGSSFGSPLQLETGVKLSF